MGKDREIAEERIAVGNTVTSGFHRGVTRVLADALAVALVFTIASCGGKERGVTNEDVRKAQAALQPFKLELQTTLREALREGGPERAIDVCGVRAEEIATALGTNGVSMGRTSYRLRNPRNAPEPWIEPLLEEFLEKGTDRTYRAVRLSDGSVGYVEPIHVQAICLPCHGKSISPSVAERLDAAYPQDNGRDFDVGDFRGLFWVKLSEPQDALSQQERTP
jgi:hypothetical protein